MFPITSQTLSTFGPKLFVVSFLFGPKYTHTHTCTHKKGERKKILLIQKLYHAMACLARPCFWSEKKLNSSGSWHKAAMCRTVIGILLFSIVKVFHQSYCFIYHLLSGNSIENVKSFMKMYANFLFLYRKKDELTFEVWRW